MRWRGFGGKTLAVVAAATVVMVMGATSASAEPTGAIGGTVTSATTHAAIEGIEVCAENPDNFDLECASSDAGGSYTITDLPPGEYTVVFYGGGDYVTQYFDGVIDYNDADFVDVAAGLTTPSVDAAMQPATKITGTVTDATTHAGLADIVVCASQIGESFEECAASESDGSYEITGLAEGAYRVHFYQEESGGLDSSGNYLPQYFSGKREASEAEPVSVTTGHVTSGIDAAMEEGATITGVVTDAETDEPLAYAWVCASHYEEEDHDPLTERCTEAEADGSYLIAGLSTGDYAIYVDHVPVPSEPFSFHSLNFAPQFYDDQPNFATATPFHVTERQTFPGINFAMHAGATISGTIVDAESHQPVTDVVVSLEPVGYGDYTDYPYFNFDQIEQPDGRFKIVGMPTGNFRLRMEGFGSNEGVYPPQFFSGKANPGEGAEQFSLVAGNDTTLGDIELFKEIEGSEPEEPEQGDPGREPAPPSHPGAKSGSPSPGPSQPAQPKRPVASQTGAAVAGRVAFVRRGIVSVPLQCRADAACRGVAKLAARVKTHPHRGGARSRAKKHTRTLVIGRSRFSVAAGHRATIRIRLTRKGKQLVRHSGRHGLNVRLAGRGLKPRAVRIRQRKPKRHHQEGSRQLHRPTRPSREHGQ